MTFKGKVAIVTGSASGIGAATVKALTREGAGVVLVDINEEKLKEIAEQCKQYGNKPLIISADITKDEDVKSIVKETINRFGQLDILVNNAGIAKASCIFKENFIECYDTVMNTNLRSMVHMTHLAAPYLIKSKGNIVNTSSTADRVNAGGVYLGYSISKAGVSHFTRCVASDFAPHGVRVNAVVPGGTRTNILQNAGVANQNELFNEWKEQTGLKKLAEPEEIADLILFLASDKARSVTGSTYVCDNGQVIN